jgi:hypothetical protein
LIKKQQTKTDKTDTPQHTEYNTDEKQQERNCSEKLEKYMYSG